MVVLESIQSKLRQVILWTTVVVLLLATATLFTYEMFVVRKVHRETVVTLAQIVAGNATSSLSFQNEEDANSILKSLRAEPTVRLALLYDENGEILATYSHAPGVKIPLSPGPDRTAYEQGSLVIVRPVIEKTRRLGTLYLESDLAPLYDRIRFFAVIATIVFAGSFLLAFILSSWTQRRVTTPILELAALASVISEKRDYTVRATKRSEDEIGALTEAFNHMLSQIAARDAALRQGAERLRLALESSQTGTWDWNLRTNELTWDDYLHDMFQIQPEDFSGKYESFLHRVHPEDQPTLDRRVRQALQSQRDFIAEYRVLLSDGTFRYFSSRGRVFPDEKGQAARMTGVTIDITESKRAEQNIRESEERFRTMADAAPVLIWTSAIDGGCDYFNRAWLNFTGRDLEAELGHRWMERVHPDDRDGCSRTFNEAFEKHRAFERRFRLLRKDGDYRWLRDHGAPRFAPDGSFRGYIGSAIDITDILHAQDELERRVATRTAELAETNRELESFTYSVSHDLRAPLRHINAYAQILEEDFSEKLPQDARDYLSRIRIGTKNMGLLVDDLLNLARVGRQELGYETVLLNQVVNSCLEELRPELLHRNIDWHIHDLGPALCDPGLIKQVFANLLSNSIKYTRPRDLAVIEVGRQETEQETIYFVRDNGVGFNMKYASKLFGVFQRLHRADEFEGTGVGLATVERIIRKHGGRIWAESELDKGAVFFFTLPALKQGTPEKSDGHESAGI